MVNGAPVYVYFSDWRSRPTEAVYRFHWGRLAINPHTADGSSAAPSAAPSYCLGMPQNTCDMAGGGTPSQQTMPGMPGMPMEGMPGMEGMPANPDAVWEIALPNDSYRVRVVAGDPSFVGNHMAIAVEDVE